MPRGRLPPRTGERSSSNVTSRIPWTLCSSCQCPRTPCSQHAGSARSGPRLVIPETTAWCGSPRFLLVPWRSREHTWASPGPSLEPVRAVLAVRWRSSLRPCPLSTLSMTALAAATARGSWTTRWIACGRGAWLPCTRLTASPPRATMRCEGRVYQGAVESAQDVRQGRGTGGLGTGTAQGPYQLLAIAAAPVGHRAVTAVATPHRDAHHRQHRAQGMPPAPWIAGGRNVVYAGDEGTAGGCH